LGTCECDEDILVGIPEIGKTIARRTQPHCCEIMDDQPESHDAFERITYSTDATSRRASRHGFWYGIRGNTLPGSAANKIGH